jgi:hypothetical protein
MAMARKKLDDIAPRCVGTNPPNEDARALADAALTVFGSREEMREAFAEWEAALVEAINRVCERARRESSSEEPPAPAVANPFVKTT